MEKQIVTFVGIAGTDKDYLLAPSVLISYLNTFEDINHNFDITIQNYFLNTDEKTILEGINKLNPSIVLFSCYMWNYDKIKNICKYLSNDILKIFGGPEIEKTHKLGNNIYISNQGEKYIRASLYGKIEEQPFDLSTAPSAYLNGYFDKELILPSIRANFETSRGCNFRCGYCLYHKNMPRIEYRNPEEAANEIVYAYKHGIKVGKIVDANLLANKEHFTTLFNILIKNNVKMKLSIDVHPLFVNRDVAKIFKQYTSISPDNNLLIGMGLQSMNKESLLSINRYVPITAFDCAVKLLTKSGCTVVIDTILGLPKENELSYLDMVSYVTTLCHDNKNYVSPFVLKVLPGTQMEKIAKDENLIIDKLVNYTIYETPTMERERMVRCLRITAILNRIFGSSRLTRNNNVEKMFKKVATKYGIINTYDYLVNACRIILPNSCDFCKSDFPKAENFYYGNMMSEISDEFLIKTLEEMRKCEYYV